MASERIDGLRRMQFATERRGGYDRAQVDAYLADLAAWLETDEAKTELAQREIERIGERTGAILSAAQQSADETLAEARAEVESQRADAEREASEARSQAEAYAAETRAAADAEAKATRESADADADRSRSGAEEHARLTIREADARLERAAQEAAERTANVDSEIAALTKTRDALIANLEELVSGVQAAIEGPGGEDLGLPERSRTAAAFADSPAPSPPVGDADLEGAAAGRTTVEDGEVPLKTKPDTRVESVAEHPVVVPGPSPGDDDATRPYTPNFDTDEDLLDDARPPAPLPSGRDPERRRSDPPDDPTTDEKKLNELL